MEQHADQPCRHLLQPIAQIESRSLILKTSRWDRRRFTGNKFSLRLPRWVSTLGRRNRWIGCRSRTNSRIRWRLTRKWRSPHRRQRARLSLRRCLRRQISFASQQRLDLSFLRRTDLDATAALPTVGDHQPQSNRNRRAAIGARTHHRLAIQPEFTRSPRIESRDVGVRGK